MPTTPANATLTNSASPYPVDSTTRRCCGAIGRHTADCLANIPVPAGALDIDDWKPTPDASHTYRWFTGEFIPAIPGRDWLGAQIIGHQHVSHDGEVTTGYMVSPVAGVGNAVIPSQALMLAAAIRRASERAAELQAAG